ncbi:hypothetical protein RJJ37_24860 [Rhizobium redzepovicii]|uniref:Copper resistance protein D domain-containing protein n=1 Tax=Rhizobium redzepovicii TaxID=2867518 RepID=A0AAW8P765_9HYPH|nr:CopD family protein [Rhizobium redzepovicii]MDR9762821.1 hypothetical protein [Rhizobium redzepovicii]MDR9780950.1 hypothetical protein [Rhizobium redzepovicii]
MRSRAPAEGRTRDQAIEPLTRFSTAGHVAVIVVILSDVANMLFILGGPPLDWTFVYQRLLTIKIGLVAEMTQQPTARCGALKY